LWRLIRYNLIKQFPNLKITLNKLNKDTYAVNILEKDITINFTCNFKKSDKEMFEVIQNSLITQIKDMLFINKKTKKKNF